jgi:hypothetical protein
MVLTSVGVSGLDAIMPPILLYLLTFATAECIGRNASSYNQFKSHGHIGLVGQDGLTQKRG